MINKKTAEKIQADLMELQSDAETFFTLSEISNAWRRATLTENSEILASFWAHQAQRHAYNIAKKYFNVLITAGVETIETETERKQVSHTYKIDARRVVRVSVGSGALYVQTLIDGNSHGFTLPDTSIYFDGKTNQYANHKEYEIADPAKEAEILESIKIQMRELMGATQLFNRTMNTLTKEYGLADYLHDNDIKGKIYCRLWRAE
jgi:hypothetical protein